MDPDLVKTLIPIVAIVSVFGFPVLVTWVVQHYRFKHKELQADLEARKALGERDRAYLEARIDRLEQALLRVAGLAPPADKQAQGGALPDPGLFEPPPAAGDPAAPPKRDPTRA